MDRGVAINLSLKGCKNKVYAWRFGLWVRRGFHRAKPAMIRGIAVCGDLKQRIGWLSYSNPDFYWILLVLHIGKYLFTYYLFNYFLHNFNYILDLWKTNKQIDILHKIYFCCFCQWHCYFFLKQISHKCYRLSDSALLLDNSAIYRGVWGFWNR